MAQVVGLRDGAEDEIDVNLVAAIRIVVADRVTGERLEAADADPARQRKCTLDLRPYCGCDGVTFRTSGSCPGQRFSARAECPGDAAP